jgi:hypothetical protein
MCLLKGITADSYGWETNPGEREISRDKWFGGIVKFSVLKVLLVYVFLMTTFME